MATPARCLTSGFVMVVPVLSVPPSRPSIKKIPIRSQASHFWNQRLDRRFPENQITGTSESAHSFTFLLSQRSGSEPVQHHKQLTGQTGSALDEGLGHMITRTNSYKTKRVVPVEGRGGSPGPPPHPTSKRRKLKNKMDLTSGGLEPHLEPLGSVQQVLVGPEHRRSTVRIQTQQNWKIKAGTRTAGTSGPASSHCQRRAPTRARGHARKHTGCGSGEERPEPEDQRERRKTTSEVT